MLPDTNYEIIDGVPFTCINGLQTSKLMLVNTPQEWEIFYRRLSSQKLVSCDTETSGFRWFAGDRIVGMSFGWNLEHYYIPVRHLDSVSGGVQPPQLDMASLREDLINFFSRQDVFTIWHNWGFDAKFYRADGIEILTPRHDTLHLWQFYDENAPGALKTIASGWTDELGRHQEGLVGPVANAAELALSDWRAQEARARRDAFRAVLQLLCKEFSQKIEHQDKSKKELKEWVEQNVLHDHRYRNVSKHDIHYGYVPIPLMTEYAATDTLLTYLLYKYVMSKLPMDSKQIALYKNEIKLSRVLMEAEWAGMAIDRGYLEKLGLDLDEEISVLIDKIKTALGKKQEPLFNLNSNDQLASALSDIGVPLDKKTKSGKLCVDAKVLGKLKSHEVVKDILSLRAAEKIRGTYVTGIIEKLTPENVLHCSFNQNVTTGRMSGRDPNLTNIPNRDDRIRRAFIPPSDEYIYVLADYSQIEVRLTAHYSQDPLLLETYRLGQDVHTRTMCEMFGYSYDDVSSVLSGGNKDHELYTTWDHLRTVSKRIVFGCVYGVGAPGLSEQIPRPDQYKDLSEKEWIRVCQDYLDSFFKKYFGVKRFINRSARQIRKDGYVVNGFGRVRHLPHAHADKILGPAHYWRVGRAERQGTNFLIQGEAADLFKTAVVRIYDLLEGKKSYLANFVHDEIQVYMHKSELHLLNEMKRLMEDFNYDVPIIAEFSYTTTNWAEKRKLG